MKIFPCSDVRKIDAYTIENEPVRSIDLMERAAGGLFRWIAGHFQAGTVFRIFAGPGNNGGDALALARMLVGGGYPCHVHILETGSSPSGDFDINYRRLAELEPGGLSVIGEETQFPVPGPDEIVIDGLFGSGLNRPLEGLPAKLVGRINSLPNRVIAIDMPSGLFGEDNRNNIPENIIRADITLSFQFPRLAFLMPENGEYVGNWHVLPIGLHAGFIDSLATPYRLLEREQVAGMVHARRKFAHKGNFGHALLISGCYGKMGAAVLAARACLRTGTGLLTIHIPGSGYQIIQTAVPEAMVSIDRSDILFTGVNSFSGYSAVGVGPGLGCRKDSQKGISRLLENCRLPMVLDADAINILGMHKDWLPRLQPGTVLTPHPGEFERITGPAQTHLDRISKQVELSNKFKVVIVLKGAYSSITCPDGRVFFNSTGNPGMATAGSGDVLTGIILSLLAQGYNPEEASMLGVYLHGLAGDLAAGIRGQEAMIAGDITECLGMAFKQLKINDQND